MFRHPASRASLIALAAALAFWGARPALAQETAPYVKHRLEIEAPGPLRDALREALDLTHWKDYSTMTPELLRRLAADAVPEAEEIAATEGYFSAKAEARVEETPDAWIVRVKVDPGEPTRVESVEIAFAGPLAAGDAVDAEIRAQVREAWSLQRGAIFRQAAWDEAKRRAVDAASERRYVSAQIADSEATVDPGRRSAVLRVTIDSGPVFRFGSVVVTGTQRYDPARIIALRTFESGDEYDREKLTRFQRRVIATGYFASTQAVVDASPEQAGEAPVRVAVIEAPAKRLDLFLGYSTDTEFRATASWRHNDFLARGWRLRTDARFETKIQGISGAIDFPEQRGGWGDSVVAQVMRTDIENLVTEDLTLGVRRRWLDERSRPEYGATFVAERQKPQGAEADDVYATLAEYGHTWRTTDDLLSPRRGYVAQILLGAAPPGISTREFARAVGRFNWFLPLSARDDFSFRAEAGAVIADSSSGIPQAMLFRTGGDTTVRGYAFQSLGVKKGDAIVGGRYLAILSAEYTRWVGEDWGLAAFVDAGNAVDDLSGARLALGYGVGVRVRSPIGPFRLDVAYGEETGSVRLHFSVGLSF